MYTARLLLQPRAFLFCYAEHVYQVEVAVYLLKTERTRGVIYIHRPTYIYIRDYIHNASPTTATRS